MQPDACSKNTKSKINNELLEFSDQSRKNTEQYIETGLPVRDEVYKENVWTLVKVNLVLLVGNRKNSSTVTM